MENQTTVTPATGTPVTTATESKKLSLEEQILEEERILKEQAERASKIGKLTEAMYEQVSGRILERRATPEVVRTIVQLHQSALANNAIQPNEELEIIIRTKSAERSDLQSYAEQAKKARIQKAYGVGIKPIEADNFEIKLSLDDLLDRGQDAQRLWIKLFQDAVQLHEALLAADENLAIRYRRGEVDIKAIPELYRKEEKEQ